MLTSNLWVGRLQLKTWKNTATLLQRQVIPLYIFLTLRKILIFNFSFSHTVDTHEIRELAPYENFLLYSNSYGKSITLHVARLLWLPYWYLRRSRCYHWRSYSIVLD